MALGYRAETDCYRSRLTWAFARDKGLPFSEYFAHVNEHHRIPTRAVSLVAIVVVLLSLINIGKPLVPKEGIDQSDHEHPLR